MNPHAFLLQAVPPAPGRGDDVSAAPAAPQAGTQVPSSASPPPSPPGGAFGAVLPLLFVVPLVLVMWFTSRGQQKKQKELEDKLKTGDQVVTQSGLIGKLIEKNDRTVKIEIASGVRVKMLRSAIVGLDPGDEGAKITEAGRAATASKKD